MRNKDVSSARHGHWRLPWSTQSGLIHRLRDRSDAEAWREFEHRHAEWILRFCRACGLQPADGDDVLQAVMLALSQNLGHFTYDRMRGRFRAYLGAVVRHEIGRTWARRSAGRAPLTGGVDLPAQCDATLDEQWQREWVLHHYRLAYTRLRREVSTRTAGVFEALMRGAAVDDVAAAYDLTPAAVRKIKQRVRLRMHRLIRDQVQDE